MIKGFARGRKETNQSFNKELRPQGEKEVDPEQSFVASGIDIFK